MLTFYSEHTLFERFDTLTNNYFKISKGAFIFVKEGTISFERNGSFLKCEYHSIVILSSGDICRLIEVPPNVKLNIISIDVEKLKQLDIVVRFNRYALIQLLRSKQNHFIFSNELTFENLLTLVPLMNYYQKMVDTPSGKEIFVHLFQAFAHILNTELYTHLSPNLSVNKVKEDNVIKFLSLVANHFKEEKELNFYADKLFITAKYLSNCVREVTGFPPTKFLAEAVLGEAKHLLLNTRDSISEISDALYFSDQYAFGKFFKKHTGVSPRTFRQQNSNISTF